MANVRVKVLSPVRYDEADLVVGQVYDLPEERVAPLEEVKAVTRDLEHAGHQATDDQARVDAEVAKSEDEARGDFQEIDGEQVLVGGGDPPISERGPEQTTPDTESSLAAGSGEFGAGPYAGSADPAAEASTGSDAVPSEPVQVPVHTPEAHE